MSEPPTETLITSPAVLLRQIAEDAALTTDLRTRLLAAASIAEGASESERTFIAKGGMGEVFRVRDPKLRRSVVLKTLRPDLRSASTDVTEQFITEARVTALLDHPGVVPVYDLGRDAEGRPWFTMREIEGRTLDELIREVHEACDRQRWRPTRAGWTFRRLVGVFERVCETVAYAHARGVVHRDLKPENVMVGPHGEVLVLDWGVAAPLPGGPREVWSTRPAAIAGTPAYMAPEQAWGKPGAINPRADVYSLGAILYELLAGRRPYVGEPLDVLKEVRRAAPPPPSLGESDPLEPGATFFGEETLSLTSAAQQLIPAALRELCLRSMDREPAARHPDAGAVAAEIRAWLDGSERRELALAMASRAERLLGEVERTSATAAETWARSREAEVALEPWAEIAAKRAVWDLEAQARAADRRSAELELEATELLHAAIQQDPDLDEANGLLADLYQRKHAAAERQRDDHAAARFEALVRAYDRGRYAAYLDGQGALSLRTEPAGALAILQPVRLHDRRLTAGEGEVVGKTPLRSTPVPMGSWMVELRHPRCATVRYPVHITRLQHWQSERRRTGHESVVRLPREWELDEDECYVPAGPFRAGDAGDSPGAGRPEEIWVGPFVVARFPVTNDDYLAFLNGLRQSGRLDEALRHAPRERGSSPDDAGALIYGLDEARGFFLQPDADGDLWAPDWPVTMIDWFGAQAYTQWKSAQTGRPYRLLREHEWEKAARGVDGRSYPWGDHFDATWARTRSSTPGRALPASVFDYPTDESPYGVRGMAGGARTWCADAWSAAGMRPEDPPPVEADARVIRGGAWSAGGRISRSASRDGDAPTSRKPYLGLRVAREWGD